MVPDVNVLLAAFRSDHPHHRIARQWLLGQVGAAARGEPLLLLPTVIASFLRLVTHPRVFPDPAPPDAAVDFVDALLASPGTEIPEGGRDWPELKRLILEHGLAANDVPDAWIAASVRTLGTRLVTFDSGFTRLLGRSELLLLRG
ncbi:MAG: PIN domain-containing protein [Steroidobacteraceae bacterium]|jgi:toxin-antitoxin system PIN domain toxin|nr:PIN domain-containing protein [Steroidobacteraceae bacterium]